MELHSEGPPDLSGVIRGPGGEETPYVYAMDGTPTDLMTGADLFEDGPARTLARSEVAAPDGREFVVSTMFLVFDDAAAVCDPDPVGPRLWGTALLRNGGVHVIEEYRSAEEAVAGHAGVVTRLRNGDLLSGL
jgi:hypothetical protein